MFQLIALSHSSKGPSEVAKDMGVHPYPLQKMNTFAKQLSKDDARTVADILADCDNKIKRSGNEPWTLIEQALLKLASR